MNTTRLVFIVILLLSLFITAKSFIAVHNVEEWSDDAAVTAHMNAPHMAELMSALGTAKIEAISINAYEAHFLKTVLGGG